MKKYWLFLMCLFFFMAGVHGEQKLYYEINIDTEIGSKSWLYLKNGLKESLEKKSDAVFIHLNTYGGQVDFADSMRTAILNHNQPIYVFIDNNAASAGALISIACDSIYMRKGANIGAATVVDGETGEKAMDKYQSYMRSMIRSTAESHGMKVSVVDGDTVKQWVRDPRIAEAMVDESVVVPGVVDSTQILTFTANEAVKHGYCEGVYETIDEIIVKALKEDNYEITSYTPTMLDGLKGFLMNPALQGVLIMLIIGGIYFEMQTPGIGFALAVAIGAAVLYFAPLYMDGLAEVWEGLVVLIGVVLIAVEIFLLPGFGIAGILGILMLVAGLVMSLVPNQIFSFESVTQEQLTTSLLTVLLSIVGSVALVVYLSNKIGTDGLFKGLALNTSLDDNKEKESIEKSLLGKIGVTVTVLGPSGKIEIDGEEYNAVSESGYLEPGIEVEVKRYSTGQLYVKIKK
jgi:membrane-bound serine protease (ClpP class)